MKSKTNFDLKKNRFEKSFYSIHKINSNRKEEKVLSKELPQFKIELLELRNLLIARPYLNEIVLLCLTRVWAAFELN